MERTRLRSVQLLIVLSWHMFASIAAKINNFRLCLHGTGQEFHRSKICEVHTVYTEPSLFLHENIFCLHGTGYLRSYSEPAGFFSAIYHVNMRRSIPFSVMAPKRKAADVEENDSTDTEKYFTWTDEEVSLLLQIATAYIKTKKQTKERIGNRSNHATKIFRNYFVSDIQNQRQSLNIFPMP